MKPADYYLGVPEPSWLNRGDGVPKFVTAPRLDRYRSGGDRWPVGAQSRYALDSGAFMALTGTNTDVPFFCDDDTYGGMIARFVDNNGYPPDFVAPRDMPCEESVRGNTGLTVRDHQDLTCDSYDWLVREFPWLPWIPVLQGDKPKDYKVHERMYLDRGVDLAGAHRVGVGSICRRGHVPEIVELIEELAESGYKLHGFGIKITALPIIGHLLTSADSMAWSYDARYPYPGTRLDGCTHGGANCANCYRYAVQWRERVLASLDTTTPARALDERAGNGIEKETIIVSTATIKPGMKVPFRDLPEGAHFECPGTACGRQARVLRDHRISKHYCYGRQTCDLAGKFIGATEVKYLREPAAPVGRGSTAGQPPVDALTYTSPFTGAKTVHQRVDAAPAAAGHVVQPNSDTEAAAVFASLIGKATPTAEPAPEPEPWNGIGPEPIDGVDLREVALGTFGKVYGLRPNGQEGCVAGYVVEVREVVKNYQGWTPDEGLVVLVGAHPDALDGSPVWVGTGEQQMTVCEPPERMPRGTAAPSMPPTIGSRVVVDLTDGKPFVSVLRELDSPRLRRLGWFAVNIPPGAGIQVAGDLVRTAPDGAELGYLPAGWTAAAYTAPPASVLVDKACRMLGLEVTESEVSRGFYELDGVDRRFRDHEELAGYLYGSDCFWMHRTDPRPAQRHIDEAIAAGTFTGERLDETFVPLRRVNEGAWIRIRGQRYRDVQCTEPIPGHQLVEGELMGWWTANHGGDRSGPVFVRMRIDDPSVREDGKRVISVGISGKNPAMVDVVDLHPEPGPADTRPALPVGAVVPLHEVPWGTFGRFTGYHPDGSPLRKAEGYLTSMVRLYTGGLMNAKKRGGPDEPVLTFDFLQTNNVHSALAYCGAKADLDAKFTVLEPPADKPLPTGEGGYGLLIDYHRTSRSERMPRRDMRAGDVIEDGELGTKHGSGVTTLLLADPRPVGDRKVELLLERDGRRTRRTVAGSEWIGVAEAVPFRPEHVELQPWPADLEASAKVVLLFPVVKRAKSNSTGFTVVCPVETCTGLRDGWTTVRGAMVGWRSHCEQVHPDDISRWDTDTWPSEPVMEFTMPAGPAKAVPCSVEVMEPKDDWSWAALRRQMEQDGRVTDLGERGVRVAFDHPKQAKAFAKVVMAGGVPPSYVTVNLPDTTKPLPAKAMAGLKALVDGASPAPAAAAGPEQMTIDMFLAAYAQETAK